MGSQINSDSPTIPIPQGKLVGVKLHDSLPEPVDGWLGVPYAQPPIGDLRFRLPVKVSPSPDTVIDASKYGPAGPGKALLPGPPLEKSEDCLTANVFRKSAGKHEKLPVALYIHGGAFNRGSAHMHKTASMVANAPEPFIAISFNYRIGALGFLPSSLSAKEGALNLGLKDQILMMEWVQENIEAFGGDPKNVTLFGLSAGAHSIGHHIMHHKEGVAPLFHKAIIESGAPTSRAVRPYDAPIHEAQFKDFLREVGVPEDLPENDIFPYLRKQPEKVVTDAQTAIFDKYNPSLRWAFQPVIDGEIIARPPLETWKQGKWHKVPIMTGFTTNEGSLYVDKTMSESSQFRHFWAELLPLLSPEDLDTIEELYRDPAKYEDSEYKETRKDMGSQYKRIEAAYAHYAYVAPARQTAELASPSVPVYLYHWAALSTVNNGAQHADNMRYEVCDPKVMAVSQTQKDLAKTLNHYVTSFITKGDPNAVAGEYPDRPKWEAYNTKDPKVLRFGDGNEELIGGDAGTAAVFSNDEWGRKQSEFWWSKVDISQQHDDDFHIGGADAYEDSLQSDHNIFDNRNSSAFLDSTQDEGYFNTSHTEGGPAQDRYLSYQQPDLDNDGANQQYHALSNAPSNDQSALFGNEPHYKMTDSSQPAVGIHRMPGRGNTSSSANRASSSASRHARSGSDSKFRVQKESHPHKDAHLEYSAQDVHTWPIRERNRQAAIRFRTRQRQGLARLKSDEQAVEKRYEELRNLVNSLNKEILCLKMQVLQHTNCNCIPVHHYVEQEAQQYLYSMSPM
ncbi:hypothetical protein HG530_006672 [Fusarium avenaceum]|nr:hypothetical protein HG530_006672 [Fusarium avenaceum]